MAAAIWCILAIAGVLLNRLVNYVLESAKATEVIQSTVSLLALSVPLFLGIGVVISSIADIFEITVASVRRPDTSEGIHNEAHTL